MRETKNTITNTLKTHYKCIYNKVNTPKSTVKELLRHYV